MIALRCAARTAASGARSDLRAGARWVWRRPGLVSARPDRPLV